MIISNNSDNHLYVKYGSGASLTGYSFRIASNAFWEMPLHYYRGRVDGIWLNGVIGTGIITEIT
jgi:hypothetical protein